MAFFTQIRSRISGQRQSRRRSPQRRSQPSLSSVKHSTRRQKLYKKIGQIALLVILVIVVMSAVFSFYSWQRLLKLEWRDEDRYSHLDEWEGKDNLNVLLIGIDDKPGGLKFVDSLQLVYLQPVSRKVDILGIDTGLHYKISSDTEDSLGNTVTTAYAYKQLYNYYLVQDDLLGTDSALDEFVFTIETELGLNIDRYILLEKSRFTQVMGPIGGLRLKLDQDINIPAEEINLKKGIRSLPVEQQLEYISAQVNSADQPGLAIQGISHSDTLDRQVSYLRQYLLQLGSPIVAGRYLVAFSQINNPHELIKTNCNGEELWQLYKFIRKTDKFSYSSSIISQGEIYILQGKPYLDKRAFDDKVRKLYLNQDVMKEQGRVDVVNGSGKPGLAAKTKRILSNHSFNIVRVANSEETYTRPVLYIEEPELFPQTIKQLQHFYPDIEIKKEMYRYRPTGDMVLVVV